MTMEIFNIYLTLSYFQMYNTTENTHGARSVRVKGRKTTYETYDLTLYQHERINLI